MFRRPSVSRRIVTSWILATAFALMSAAVALADGNGGIFPH